MGKLKAESPKVTSEESKYRQKKFSGDFEKVLKLNLMCTVCNKPVKNCVIKGTPLCHPLLEVLICHKCLDFYGDGNFSVDEDNSDRYCRWCGQGGTIYQCSKCPRGFCKKDVKRNLSIKELEKLEDEDWICFLCDVKPLYELRAVCWGAVKYASTLSKTKSKKKSVVEEIVLDSSSDESEKVSKTGEKTKNNELNDKMKMYKSASQRLSEILVQSEKVADLFKAKAQEIRRRRAAPSVLTSVGSVKKAHEKILSMVEAVKFGLNEISDKANNYVFKWEQSMKEVESSEEKKDDTETEEEEEEKATKSSKSKKKSSPAKGKNHSSDEDLKNNHASSDDDTKEEGHKKVTKSLKNKKKSSPVKAKKQSSDDDFEISGSDSDEEDKVTKSPSKGKKKSNLSKGDMTSSEEDGSQNENDCKEKNKTSKGVKGKASLNKKSDSDGEMSDEPEKKSVNKRKIPYDGLPSSDDETSRPLTKRKRKDKSVVNETDDSDKGNLSEDESSDELTKKKKKKK